MNTKFEKGHIYVFSKRLHDEELSTRIMRELFPMFDEFTGWADEIDGKYVKVQDEVTGFCRGKDTEWRVHPMWCTEVASIEGKNGNIIHFPLGGDM